MTINRDVHDDHQRQVELELAWISTKSIFSCKCTQAGIKPNGKFQNRLYVYMPLNKTYMHMS